MTIREETLGEQFFDGVRGFQHRTEDTGIQVFSGKWLHSYILFVRLRFRCIPYRILRLSFCFDLTQRVGFDSVSSHTRHRGNQVPQPRSNHTHAATDNMMTKNFEFQIRIEP